jgi:hypothetical protein
LLSAVPVIELESKRHVIRLHGDLPSPSTRHPDAIFIPDAFMQCQFAGNLSINQYIKPNTSRDVTCISRNRTAGMMRINKHRVCL